MECAADENLLFCLLRHNVDMTFSCLSGSCQSCMVKVVSGDVSERAQLGLRDTHKADGFVLACQCVPSGDLEVARRSDEGLRAECIVEDLALLNETVMSVRVRPRAPLSYRAGQFFNILHEGVARSYSAASVPDLDAYVEFHVARVASGQVSGWIHHELQRGDSMTLLGPQGHCFYTEGDQDQPLLLAGTGTGLAPLYGIARDALHRGHRGDIHLFHGALEPAGLYLVETLKALADSDARFHYHPCALRGEAPEGIVQGALDELMFQSLPKLNGWRAYFCGHPDMVRLLQRKAFMAGASMKQIYADAFLPSVAATPVPQ